MIIAAGALLLAAGFGSTGPLTMHDPAAALVPVLLALLVALCASPRMVARLRASGETPDSAWTRCWDGCRMTTI